MKGECHGRLWTSGMDAVNGRGIESEFGGWAVCMWRIDTMNVRSGHCDNGRVDIGVNVWIGHYMLSRHCVNMNNGRCGEVLRDHWMERKVAVFLRELCQSEFSKLSGCSLNYHRSTIRRSCCNVCENLKLAPIILTKKVIVHMVKQQKLKMINQKILYL